MELREMRSKDRAVTELSKIEEVLSRCDCCRVGFADQGDVYIVPLNFGYDWSGEGCTLYFHGAKAGRKWELLQTSPTVGIELDCGYALMPADTACAHAAHFQSIIGTGRAEIIEDESQQRHALDALMRHAAGKGGWEIPAAALKSTCVFKVTVETLSCKQY